MSKPICQHCSTGVQLFEWCRNLSAGTVMQGCSCLSGVETYLLALCCSCLRFVETYMPVVCIRGAAVEVVSKPICRHCSAEVQLFKRCPNLSAGTVLQGCSCLSSVTTYLRALCCRGAAVKAVSKPTWRHCVAGVELFKQCPNLSAGTVLQGCSCLSSVPTYLLALCCRGAAVYVVSEPT